MTPLLVLIAIIVLLVVGAAVLGLALKLLWWVLIGLIIGGLGRLVLRGYQPIGWVATALYGIAGALLGGVVARAVGTGGFVQFLIAVAVAALLIVVLDGRGRPRLT
jgi:uncharacterized membrane protein YeaQ/YmgE (transglycosylase-associated protein family)